jgi:hypothetical protein
VVGGIILVIVLTLVILAKDYLPIVGWVVITLAIMGMVPGGMASGNRDQETAVRGDRKCRDAPVTTSAERLTTKRSDPHTIVNGNDCKAGINR